MKNVTEFCKEVREHHYKTFEEQEERRLMKTDIIEPTNSSATIMYNLSVRIASLEASIKEAVTILHGHMDNGEHDQWMHILIRDLEQAVL